MKPHFKENCRGMYRISLVPRPIFLLNILIDHHAIKLACGKLFAPLLLLSVAEKQTKRPHRDI